MSSQIETTLLAATKQRPQKNGEHRQAYLLRLALTATEKLTDEEWDGLAATAGAQEWVNAAIDADNAKEQLDDFPDLQEEASAAPAKKAAKKPAPAPAAAKKPAAKPEVEEELEEDENDLAESDAPVKGKSSASKQKPAAAPAKKSPPTRASGGSLHHTLKMIIVKKPQTSIDDLIKAAEKAGFPGPSRLTVATIRSDTRNTLKVMNEAGLISIEL